MWRLKFEGWNPRYACGVALLHIGYTQHIAGNEGILGFKDAVIGQIAKTILERPGAKRSLAEWIDALVTSGAAIDARAAGAADQSATGKAAQTLRHITGIEAWGQSRLRVLLGAPLQVDEYDAYAPGVELDVAPLRAAFAATRDATVALVRQLADAHVDDTQTVVHNSFGPLTARGWLAYLESHATREASRIQ